MNNLHATKSYQDNMTEFIKSSWVKDEDEDEKENE